MESLHFFSPARYTLILAGNNNYLILESPCAAGSRKNLKNVQLQPFFWRAFHMEFLEQNRKEQNRTEQNRTGQNRTERDRTGQNWKEQERTEQNRIEQHRTERN